MSLYFWMSAGKLISNAFGNLLACFGCSCLFCKKCSTCSSPCLKRTRCTDCNSDAIYHNISTYGPNTWVCNIPTVLDLVVGGTYDGTHSVILTQQADCTWQGSASGASAGYGTVTVKLSRITTEATWCTDSQGAWELLITPSVGGTATKYVNCDTKVATGVYVPQFCCDDDLGAVLLPDFTHNLIHEACTFTGTPVSGSIVGVTATISHDVPNEFCNQNDQCEANACGNCTNIARTFTVAWTGWGAAGTAGCDACSALNTTTYLHGTGCTWSRTGFSTDEPDPFSCYGCLTDISLIYGSGAYTLEVSLPPYQMKAKR